MSNQTFQPYLAYSASAGSGKTFALSVRYISLLFLEVEPSSILAATFTNKAASEMKQRVLNLLINLSEKKTELLAISEQTGLSQEVLLAKQPLILENFLSSTNFIVTLDSFFTSILRSASLYITIEPDFVTKEIDEKIKEKNFLDEISANALLSQLVKLAMNIEDRRFLKMFELMQNFYKIDPLLPQKKYELINISKIESQIESQREVLYQLVLASSAPKTAIKNFEPMETKVLFKKSVFKKESLLEHRNYKKYVKQNPDIEEEFLNLKSLLSEWANAKEQVILHNLFQLFDYYKNANITTARELGVLSFDDLSFFTHRLLYESINKEFLYFKIDSRFQHILLDEFQDTSTLQFLLLKPLIDELFSGVGQSQFQSFFYVGDTKQSLYRFRGGVEELFNSVANHYGITIANMETNYRSSQVLVEQVNRWFKPNMEGFPKAKYKEGASIGYVEVRESELLVDEAILSLESLLKRGVALTDIAFLVSTNKDGASIQEACYLKGYATRLKTSSSLKHTPKIASLVAMMAYLFGGLELNATALLQQIDRPLKEMDTSWFHPFMQPVAVLHRLIVDFGYFEEDLNLLKLLEFASDFSNIPTFIEEFELSRIDVSSSSKEGAMIITIHGSKGLEFEHVILLDRLKGMAPDRSTLLYDYNDSLDIKEVYYKIGGRENFDISYQEILEKQKRLLAKDKMNILYVALTRAVQGMIIIKKPKASIFDPLGITPMSMGEFSIIQQPKKQNRSPLLEKVTLSYYGAQEVDKEEDEEDKDYDAILFGLALHYTLEMMSSFSIMRLDEAISATKNHYGLVLDEDKLSDIKSRVLLLLTHERFKKILHQATIKKEQSLAFEGQFKQIDLLLDYDKSSMVLEYKSSKKYHQKHQSQVQYYKKAISSITGKYTSGVIIYLLKDGVEFVDV